MGVNYVKGTFTKATTTGDQDITTLTFQPKALIIFTSNQTVETYEEHAMLSYGFSDGTTDCCVVASTEDNVTTSDTYNNLHNDSIIQIINDTTGVLEARATLSSFLSNGFRLNWATNTALAAVCHFIAIGGTDLTNVKVGTQNVTKTTTGNQSYTGVGFQPDFLFTMHNNIPAPATAYTYNTTIDAHFGFSLGAATSENQRWALATVSEDSLGTSDNYNIQKLDKCFTHLVITDGTTDAEADFVSFDSDGWTWNYTTNAGGNVANLPYAYLAIKGGVWTVGNTFKPASTTDQNVATETAGNGILKGIVLATTAIDTTVSGAHNQIYVGAADGLNNGTVGLSDLDASATMVVTQIQSDNECIRMHAANATAASSVNIGSGTATFKTNSFTIAYTNSDATRRPVPFFAVSEAIAQTNVLYKKGILYKTTTTGNQDITTVGFQPKALILWTSNSPVEVFEEHMGMSYGFSDGTTDCVVAGTSEDNALDSDTYNNMHNDSIVMILNKTTGVLEARATLNAWLSNGFQLNWATNAAPNAVIHYIAIGGSDITNVKVGTQSVGTTTTGSKSYTGVGFQPDFLQCIHNNVLGGAYTFDTTIEANFGFGISSMCSTTQRWAVACTSLDAAATSTTWRLQRKDKCFTHTVQSTGVVDCEADFTSFDSDGFTWNYSTNAGGNTTNQPFAYLAIKGGVWTVDETHNHSANRITIAETAGNAVLRGIQMVNTGTNTNANTPVSSNILTIGGSDGVNNGLVAYCDLHGQAAMIVTQIQGNDYCTMSMVSNVTASSSTILDTGAAVFKQNSFDIAYINTNASYRISEFWAVSELITNFPTKVNFKKGILYKPNATGDQDITTVGFQPKALICWGTPMMIETFLDEANMVYGFSDGTNDLGLTSSAGDNLATSSCVSTFYNDSIILFRATGTFTITAQATVSSFLTNGFRLNWSTADTNRYAIHYIAIGGSDITNVKAGSQNITKAGGALGNQSYTGAGFQPDFLLTANWGQPAVDGFSSVNAFAGFGCNLSAMKSTTSRWSTGVVSEHARADSDTWRYYNNTKCFTYLDSGTGAIAAEADFISFDSDGWTWNYTTNTTGFDLRDYIYLAFKGGVWDVGEHTLPSTNTTSVTNTNSTGILRGFMIHTVTQNSSATVATQNHLAIGGCDGINQGYIQFLDWDAQATTANAMIQNDDTTIASMSINVSGPSSTLQPIATLSSFGTSSFTLSTTSNIGTTVACPYWAVSQQYVFDRPISESSVSVSETLAITQGASTLTQVVRFQKSTGGNGTTQDITLNFTPKAIMVYSSGGTTDASTEAHWQYIQGFSDGTNHACIATSSEDAAGAADSARIHYDNRVFAKQDTATPGTIVCQGTCAFATNKVTFTWTVNDAVATDITLWAFGGDDITAAKVNTVDIGRTTAGVQNYTGLGFNPSDNKSVLFLLAANIQTTNSSSTTANTMFGCATKALNPTTEGNQWYTAHVSEHAADPSDTWRTSGSDRCIAILSDVGVFAYYGSLNAWVTDGFQLNWDAPPTATTFKFSYLVINGGTWDSGRLTAPTTATNNVDYTVTPTEAKRGLLITGNGGTQTAAIQTINSYTLGVTDGNTTSVIAAVDEDAQATMDSYRYSDTGTVATGGNIIYHIGTDGAIIDRATFDSYPTSTQFRLDWAVKSANAHHYNWVVVADETPSQNFNGNITETSITVNQTLVRILGGIRSPSEGAISINQTLSGLRNVPRTISETAISSNETLTRLLAAIRSPTESVTIDQTLARILGAIRTINQTVSISENLARIYSIGRSIEDNAVSVNDSLIRNLAGIRTPQETTSINDTIARLLSSIRSTSESETINDTLAKSYSTLRSIAENSISINETIIRILGALRSAEETVNINQTIAAIIVLLRSISEPAVNTNDTLNRLYAATRSPQETVTIEESLTRIQNILRTLSQTVGVSDSVTALIILVRSITETAITTNDSINRLLQAIRNPSQSVTINETLTKVVGYIKTISDNTITISDLLSVLRGRLRELSEDVDINETLTRRIDVTKPINESITVNEALDTIFGYSTIINEGLINTTDSLATLLAAVRDIAVSVAVAEALIRVQSVARNINENSINLTETIQGRLIELGGQIKFAGGFADKTETEIISLLINFIKTNWSNQN